ncbi:hypothetical protein AB0D67_22525 [Streptosporangium sp. NPDC048047]|uniref:hypothetical protein n=1 Tax=Streptosporangium sp. NPDC048047 TaxID=3155748 RepID=UPI0034422DD9
MSKQTAFTLTFLLGLSVIVPGSAGYLSARIDAVEQAHRRLMALENRLREERLITPARQESWLRTLAAPAPCPVMAQPQPRRRGAPMTAGLIPAPVEALDPVVVPPGTVPGRAFSGSAARSGGRHGEVRRRPATRERGHGGRRDRERAAVPGQVRPDRPPS